MGVVFAVVDMFITSFHVSIPFNSVSNENVIKSSCSVLGEYYSKWHYGCSILTLCVLCHHHSTKCPAVHFLMCRDDYIAGRQSGYFGVIKSRLDDALKVAIKVLANCLLTKCMKVSCHLQSCVTKHSRHWSCRSTWSLLTLDQVGPSLCLGSIRPQ